MQLSLGFWTSEFTCFEKRSNNLDYNETWLYFKLVGIQWTYVGIREYRFVLCEIWEEKYLKQAEPFLMWL